MALEKPGSLGSAGTAERSNLQSSSLLLTVFRLLKLYRRKQPFELMIKL